MFAALMLLLGWPARAAGAPSGSSTRRRCGRCSLALVGVLWLLAPRGVPARCSGLAWLAAAVRRRAAGAAARRVPVTVLDVGQGLAVLVQTHAHALLYDTGPRFNDDRRRRRPHHRADAARDRHKQRSTR